eukprot:11191133-Alexandrium_andersonii.AAC.1
MGSQRPKGELTPENLAKSVGQKLSQMVVSPLDCESRYAAAQAEARSKGIEMPSHWEFMRTHLMQLILKAVAENIPVIATAESAAPCPAAVAAMGSAPTGKGAAAQKPREEDASGGREGGRGRS